jgi:hypothetical protein
MLTDQNVDSSKTGEQPSVVEIAPVKKTRYSNIPISHEIYFTGRTAELNLVRRSLTANSISQRILVIWAWVDPEKRNLHSTMRRSMRKSSRQHSG